jgi:hypothetical protein
MLVKFEKVWVMTTKVVIINEMCGGSEARLATTYGYGYCLFLRVRSKLVAHYAL